MLSSSEALLGGQSVRFEPAKSSFFCLAAVPILKTREKCKIVALSKVLSRKNPGPK